MAIDIKRHPCFNDEVRHIYGRIHLPVAPRCNVQCNFCNRKFDCINESRPGVTSTVLKPFQAIYYLEEALRVDKNISVVGIAGPGDPFANGDETMETLVGVRKMAKEIILCVATNGLGIEPYIDQLADIDVSHVTITINAIDPAVGAKVYSWIRYGKKRYTGIEAAKIILEKQLNAIRMLKEAGITVKINSIVIPGINEMHISDVAKKVSELEADIMNCIPMYKNPDTLFGDIDEPDEHTMNKVKAAAREYVPLMYHCQRCRADAAGLLTYGTSSEVMERLNRFAEMAVKPSNEKPYICVASEEGILINRHLGEADEMLIYGAGEHGNEFIERRKMPESGSGDMRWMEMAEVLSDCHTILTNGAGENPRKILKSLGIEILIVEGLIDNALSRLCAGDDLKDMKVRGEFKCGMACSGSGEGC